MDEHLIVAEPIDVGMVVTLDLVTGGVRRCRVNETPFGLAVKMLLLGQQISRKDFFEGVTGPVRRHVNADKNVQIVPGTMSRDELKALIREIVQEELAKASKGPDWLPSINTLFKEEPGEPENTEEALKE